MTDTSGTHPVNTSHLVMGIVYLGLVGIWALIETTEIFSHDPQWLLPLPWVVAGILGLTASATSRRRAQARTTPAAATSPDDQSPVDSIFEQE